jgi:hypothetical protein
MEARRRFHGRAGLRASPAGVARRYFPVGLLDMLRASLAQMRSAGRIEQCPGSGEKVAASAEMRWSNGWPVAATFEGEFSDVTRSHTGKRDRSGSLTAKVTRLTRNGPRPVGSIYEPGDPKTLDIG